MKISVMRQLLTIVVVCGLSGTPLLALAGPDEFQLQMIRKLQQAKQKLQQAEAAAGAERQKLVAEHMQMMRSNMDKMEKMKPQPGMSMQQHEEWIQQHHQLMSDMMGQMMTDHHLIMSSDCVKK